MAMRRAARRTGRTGAVNDLCARGLETVQRAWGAGVRTRAHRQDRALLRGVEGGDARRGNLDARRGGAEGAEQGGHWNGMRELWVVGRVAGSRPGPNINHGLPAASTSRVVD